MEVFKDQNGLGIGLLNNLKTIIKPNERNFRHFNLDLESRSRHCNPNTILHFINVSTDYTNVCNCAKKKKCYNLWSCVPMICEKY